MTTGLRAGAFTVYVAALMPIWSAAAPYATAQEAAQRAFPQATTFKELNIQLSADEARAVAAASGLPTRSVQWRLLVALAAEKLVGVVVLDAVTGKFELIDYAVGIGADGKICNLEILAYRESHGYEVRLPAWRKQFAGKDKQSALRLGVDIDGISGATMSAEHITDGVRRIVAVVETLRASGKV